MEYRTGRIFNRPRNHAKAFSREALMVLIAEKPCKLCQLGSYKSLAFNGLPMICLACKGVG